MTEIKTKSGGRPSVYETKIAPRLSEISELYGKGVFRKNIAAHLGVSVETLRKYEAQEKDLADAFAFGRAKIAAEMRSALFSLAVGVEVKTVKVKTYKSGETVTEVITETLPPNLNAILAVLERISRLDDDSPEAIEAEKNTPKMNEWCDSFFKS